MAVDETGRSWDRSDPRWEPYRLPLGQREGEMVWSEAFPTVVIAQGRPGSGKTTGYATPALATWPGPVLCVSARHDVADVARESRARRGTVWTFDPSGTSRGGDRFDLFGREVRDYERAQQVAAGMVRSMPGMGVENEGFWRTKAQQLLAPLLLAAHLQPPSDDTLRDLLRWVKAGDADCEARTTLSDRPEATEDLDQLWRMDDRVRTSVEATLDAVLAPYRLPGVGRSLGPGFDAEALLDGDNTVFACAPATSQREIAPVLGLVVDRVLRAATEKVARTGRPARLLVVVDEAGSVARLDDLSGHTTTANGTGIAILTCFHSPAQMRATYGADDTETIMDNSSAVVVLPGQSPSAAAFLDDYAGADITGLPLGTGIRRLRAIGRDKAVVLRSGMDPVLVDVLSPWRNRDLGWDLGI